MLSLFPPVTPYKVHRLPVSGGHELHVEESGSPEGLPVLILHGGPGAGGQDFYRQFFDAERFRIILFDQRGSGRSAPLAELSNNTTQDTLADIEQIRQQLGVESWLVFGVGWGATLAVLYAAANNAVVSGLLLQGVFLGRSEDLEWLYFDGARRVFPEYWQDFESAVADVEGDGLIQKYAGLLTGDNELQQIHAAKAWARWDARCSSFHPNRQLVDHFEHPHVAISLARVSCHYASNGFFLAENEVLAAASTLGDLPGIMVHGRYDMVCPLQGAHQLNDVWPGGRLEIIRDAGHAVSEPVIIDALLKASDEMLGIADPQAS